MDILTHTLSGIAAATVIAPLAIVSLRRKLLLVACGGAGAIAPDIDALTRWPRFDAVIGHALGLSQTGRSIYYGSHWYSHHNFFHSLAAGAIFTLLAALLFYLGSRAISKHSSAKVFIQKNKGIIAAFFCGYLMHLLGDLPTPGSVWHGIKLFWPHAASVGGFGRIWWWNNYDIFLIFLFGCLFNSGLIFFHHLCRKRGLNFLPALIFLAIISAAGFQIANRPVNFSGPGSNSSHAEKERRSLAIQKDILGDRLYKAMAAADRKWKLPF